MDAKSSNRKVKSAKSSVLKRSVASKKQDPLKREPSVDEIRERAEQIYYGRIDRGEHGTELGDWLLAESELRGSDE